MYIYIYLLLEAKRSDVDFFYVFTITTATAVARVVERTVPVAFGPVVDTVGLIATAELGKSSREATGGRH